MATTNNLRSDAMSKEYYQTHKKLWEKYYAKRRAVAPLYAAWRSMMSRCGFIKGASAYDTRNYKMRGITICEAWRDYKTFENWALTHGWRRGLQIDRIDNDGNYEPNNCRFVTPEENSCNRRNTIYVVYKGERMPLKMAYNKSGCKFDYKLVNNRVAKGFDFIDAITRKKAIMNKKQEVEKQTEAFDAAFKERFKNSAGRITRTPFHVMSFLSGCWTIPHVAAFEHVRGKAIESYDRYCRRRGITRTWRNAVEFYIRGRIG